ncbi:MAG TPA: hypothetical protein DCS66_25160 [Flavobacteriaceae bacterium]|nr:hypothetical protein [Flavobacteriaceae bacterium]HAT67850.1 hypothetical protein [Flavobacteriaceae bacterium]|tara:strand:- start:8385 stop:9428 length:1044 start_codon:yes stop_codon:yes gene_type:complete
MKRVISFLLLVVSTISVSQTEVLVSGLNNASRLFLDGTTLYFTDATSLRKIDISISSPTPEIVVDGLNNAAGLFLDGNDMYVSDFSAGRIIKADVSLSNPVAEDVITGLDTPNGLVKFENFLYFTDNNSDFLGRIDLNNPDPSVEIISVGLNRPLDLTIYENLLFFSQSIPVSSTHRISQVDISVDPPFITEFSNDTDRPIGLSARTDFLLVAERDANIVSKIDITTGFKEIILSNLNSPVDIVSNETTLFLIEGENQNMITKIDLILDKNDFLNSSEIKLLPNPAKDFLHVVGLNTLESFEIIDNKGVSVKKGILNLLEPIPTTNLAQGLYYLIINNNISLRFIKE